MNTVILIGRLTRDVELKYIPNSGTPVANFVLAIDRDYKNKNGEKDTDFIPIQLMGKIAESTAQYVSKGDLVAINGSIRIEQYNKDGEKRSYTKVAAKTIQFLNTKRLNTKENGFTPNFDVNEFQAIDDDNELPFI